MSIRDPQGEVKTIITSSLGFYSLGDLGYGTHNVSVRSKRFRFSSRIVRVDGDVSNVDFMGVE